MTTQDNIARASLDLLDQLPTLSLEQLELLVRHHNHAYFDQNAPEISDEAFDKLVEALRMLEPDSLVLQQIENRPGVSSSDVVVHKHPMLSLDKCYDDETFSKWREKINGELIAMPKIDGVACSIHYDAHGKLVLAATRGDGKQGENITANVKRIQDIPTKLVGLQSPDGIEVRGEVYLRLSRFKSHYEAQFANPRNLAAGALKQKVADKSAAYELSFFPYDIKGTSLASEADKFKLLAKLGFSAPPIEVVDSLEQCKNVYLKMTEQRASLDYEIDGVVLRANRTSEQNRLGETAHHPRWSIAYKFQGEGAQTHLVDVEWSVGRTGTITPVAIVQPVFVSGATVSRASLHNLGMFNKLALTQNALVEVVRRGGVIPHVERMLRPGGHELVPPTICPSCNKPVLVDGDFLRCAEPSECPRIAMARVEHFCAVLDIQGFGEKIIKTLIDQGLVKKPADLYRLKIDHLLPLERMGQTLAAKLIAEVDKKREVSLSLFLTALGFEEVGPTIAEAIAEAYPDLAKLRQASVEDLSAIFGIGESIANSLVLGLQIFSGEIDDLLLEVKIKAPAAKKDLDETHPLFGKTVVFTGAMSQLERKEAQKRVREVGGKTPASVSASTDYLVIGDEGSALLGQGDKSTKHKAADKLIAQGASIAIVPESEFLKMLVSS